ncbi:MAG TPA: hypothetical protein PKZ27_11365 [Rhodocyclaceae bacterium]|nr:hypothetical protein [Rhodocyclaceae bacterium]
MMFFDTMPRRADEPMTGYILELGGNWGLPPISWLIALAAGALAGVLGFVFFQHSRDEFADAL